MPKKNKKRTRTAMKKSKRDVEPICGEMNFDAMETFDFNLPENVSNTTGGKRHDPQRVLQRNAAFLIESAEKAQNYNPEILEQMKLAYADSNYAKVINLSFLNDKPNRLPRRDVKNNLLHAIDDVAVEETHLDDNMIRKLRDKLNSMEHLKMALNCCQKASQFLECELTYDNRSLAKNQLDTAVQMMKDILTPFNSIDMPHWDI